MLVSPHSGAYVVEFTHASSTSLDTTAPVPVIADAPAHMLDSAPRNLDNRLSSGKLSSESSHYSASSTPKKAFLAALSFSGQV